MKKLLAYLLVFVMCFSVLPMSAQAEEVIETSETVDLSGLTTFTFEGNTVTVAKGSGTNYSVEVYDATDNEVSAVESTDEAGNTVYALSEGSTGELQVSIKKKGGSYVFQGEGSGRISVNKEATGASILYLNGLNLTSSFTSPVVIKKESTTTCTIHAVAGTTNTLTDATVNNADNYTDSDTEAPAAESAVIKAKSYAQLTLTGGGTLNLVCNSKNAVKVGEYGSLTIEELTLNVTSVKHGISVDNTMEIKSGTLNVTASEDALRSDPDAVDATTGCAGNITISGGTLNLKAGSDGVQVAQDLTISGGDFTVVTGAGYNDASFDKDTMSCKGLKASCPDDTAETTTNVITISGGTFKLNTADDAIHSDATILITGGTFEIQTGDDGVHADTYLKLGEEGASNLYINMTIATSYEGLEAGTVDVYSGIYNVTASDDGMNAAGGSSDSTTGTTGSNDSFRPGGGNWGGNMGGNAGGTTSSTGDYTLNIYGGELFVNSGGDGVDSNEDLNLLGGKLIVFGAAHSSDNSALDCDGSLVIKGGTVFAAGSSNGGQMMPTPTNSQAYLLTSGTSAAAGKTINVTYNGETIYNVKSLKTVNHYVYSSPDMTSSSGWAIKVDDSAILESETEQNCNNGHTWDDGEYLTKTSCTEDGQLQYTCLVCAEQKTETETAVGHSYQKGYCSTCGEENPEQEWFAVSFVTDDHSSVVTYLTQDVTTPYETDATVAIARDSDTGLKLVNGDGQVNFSIAVDQGYTLDSIEITEGTDNYKNLKDVDASANVYRLTKITGNLTVTITTKKASADNDVDFNNGTDNNTGTDNETECSHSWNTVAGKAATNKANGYQEYQQCKLCGETQGYQVIAKIKSVKLSATTYTYNGKTKKPSVTVLDSEGKKISSQYYKVSYASGRKQVGKYKVKVTFKGNYSGTSVKYFTICPKAPTLKSVKGATKAIAVKWTKVAKQVTGYQVQYATNKAFTKNKKSLYISKYTTTSKTVSKLKAKKTYYVRVRSYKTVDGKKIYSKWSTIKKATTK